MIREGRGARNQKAGAVGKLGTRETIKTLEHQRLADRGAHVTADRQSSCLISSGRMERCHIENIFFRRVTPLHRGRCAVKAVNCIDEYQNFLD